MKKILISALASVAIAAGGFTAPAFASDGTLNVNTACDINCAAGIGTGAGALTVTCSGAPTPTISASRITPTKRPHGIFPTR